MTCTKRVLSTCLLLAGPCAGVDRVDGTLLLANENAGWCWYQDEKILRDPENGMLHFSTAANWAGHDGAKRNGEIDHVVFNPATGERHRVVLDNLPYVDGKGDDHNIGALWIRPDGRLLHVWTGHNNDHFTRYRISLEPHDGTAWRPLQRYNWEEISGRPSSRKFTYSNLHFLSAERSGKGRLYNIGRGDRNSSNISYSDNHGETWNYAGKLTTWNGSSPSSYSNGYFKYRSNGKDRIDFIATEHHPRNFNNSIYHGYLKDGKTFNSLGELIDDDIFDERAPDPKDFTPVFLAAPLDGENDETEHHTAWTIELELTPDGQPVALFSTRFGTERAGNGNLPGAADHRLFYARFDGRKWHTTELGKMGGPLLGSEQDYLGLGTIHPDNPDHIVISTPYHPGTNEKLGSYELFEGRTRDHGKSWSWKQLTFDSTVNNLRPAIPSWDADHTALFWMRGTYRHQSDFDQALVGIIRTPGHQEGKSTYIDLNPGNVKQVGDWVIAYNYGNEGKTFESTKAGGAMIVPFTAPADGSYDLFGCFWSERSDDWRLAGGLDPDNLRIYRRSNSQLAEVDRFEGPFYSSDGSRSLYQAYLGRRQLEKGEVIDLHFEGVPDTGSGQRTSIDGIAYRPLP